MVFFKKKICWVFILSHFLVMPAFASSVSTATPSTPARPGFMGWWDSWSHDVATTWNNSPDDNIYLPVITWHNRLTYDKAKTDNYNERPWGGGYGISRYDENGDWHGLYFMAFKDSHNKWEPIGGYGYEKIWQPAKDKNFRLGLGYTAAVTARDDYSYIPIPIVLPLASISYDKLSFQATYIPGTYNNGNVFFAWLRYQF
ncbi:lipid IV(A) palmitoyltransferase PagP [Ewingella americana]|uniref:Lipid A acyltransferase PagP n=1 Tax=Ewingella americana TaxID=41202 RepID=A0A502GQS7_9GAMM|nr:lipid IV(A) palmitoyltransferase PagP [Ewingella americana]TPG64234.1 phospholipid:lipid A palmitoyltransferase [Ewingella americana]